MNFLAQKKQNFALKKVLFANILNHLKRKKN
jgi:hypothetical protein